MKTFQIHTNSFFPIFNFPPTINHNFFFIINFHWEIYLTIKSQTLDILKHQTHCSLCTCRRYNRNVGFLPSCPARRSSTHVWPTSAPGRGEPIGSPGRSRDTPLPTHHHHHHHLHLHPAPRGTAEGGVRVGWRWINRRISAEVGFHRKLTPEFQIFTSPMLNINTDSWGWGGVRWGRGGEGGLRYDLWFMIEGNPDTKTLIKATAGCSRGTKRHSCLEAVI